MRPGPLGAQLPSWSLGFDCVACLFKAALIVSVLAGISGLLPASGGVNADVCSPSSTTMMKQDLWAATWFLHAALLMALAVRVRLGKLVWSAKVSLCQCLL